MLDDPSALNLPRPPDRSARSAPRLNPELAVDDTLVLTTVDGTEDFLHSDLIAMGDLQLAGRQPGRVTVHLRGTLRAIHGCRMYSSAAIPLHGRPDREPQLQALLSSVQSGTLHALDSDGALRFRVGVQDSELRKQVVGRIESTLGWVNDAADWDINITPDQGSWTAQIGALHYSRRFGSLSRQPWSTTALVAETLIRLAKLAPTMRVHDPCCGTATLLVLSHQNTPGLQLTGTDHDQSTLAIAHSNLQRYQIDADVTRANATPFGADNAALDRVIGNLPFGKQVGSHTDNLALYPALLNETARTLSSTGRAVLLTEDKRLLVNAITRTKGLTLMKERLLRYSGATPTAYVIRRTRR